MKIGHRWPEGEMPKVIFDPALTLIMFHRKSSGGDDDHLFYVQKPEGGSWSSPIEIDQPNRSYAATYHFDAAIDENGHIYLIYCKDDTEGHPQILFSTDFGSSNPIYTGDIGDKIYEIKLHSDANGNLMAFIRRSGYNTALAYRPGGGSWSPLYDLQTAAPDGDVWNAAMVLTDTRSGVFTRAKMTYLDRETGGGPPYGPDKLYFYDSICTGGSD